MHKLRALWMRLRHAGLQRSESDFTAELDSHLGMIAVYRVNDTARETLGDKVQRLM